MPLPALSRRNFMHTAALTGAALAAPQIMVRAAHALDMSLVKPAGFARYTLGDFEITVLTDGNRMADKPQSIFGTNVTEAEVADLLKANYLPADKTQFTFSPTLVNTGTDLVLFDTGNGEGGREGGVGQTLANLQAAGYKPEDVTVVAISHMHPDHIGGMMEGGALAYPNARYVLGQTEFDFWKDDARMGTPAEGVHQLVKKNIVPVVEKATMIGDGGEVVPGITGMAAAGHTPGHMIFRLESGGKTMALTADTANHFVLSLQKPDWEVRFDADKAAAAAARKKVFGMLAADRMPFVGYHMPFPSVGFVEAMGDGFRFIPETYQLDL